MKFRSYEEIKAYYQGKKDGVRLYAWWKDGKQYAGTTGTLLTEAIANLVHLENETMQAFSEGTELWTP